MQYLIKTILLLIFLVVAGQSRAADLATGLAAYEQQDYQTALGQLMQLAEAGDPDAQFVMGRMFARGEGVLQDYVEAHKWYNLAASRGQRLAAASRDAVAAQMTPEQMAQAQELARAWRPLGRASLSSPNPPADGNDRAALDGLSAPPATAPVLGGSSPAATQEAAPEEAQEEELNETLIANIQLELKRLGYPMSIVDGRLGGQTVEAIQAYQRNNRLPVTGTASQRLLQHLRTQQGNLPSIRRAPPAQVRERPLPELLN